MFIVNQLSEAEHKKRRMTGSIGQPRKGEIVQYLIEEGGNCERAAQKCCDNRLKMVNTCTRVDYKYLSRDFSMGGGGQREYFAPWI